MSNEGKKGSSGDWSYLLIILFSALFMVLLFSDSVIDIINALRGCG